MNNQIKEEGLTDAYLLGKYDGYQQGRADAIEELSKEIEYCLHCGMGKVKSLEHLLKICKKLKEHNK